MLEKRRTVRGYFGIGVVNMKKPINYGTLFRSALNMGASYTFLIGRRFEKQCSDTVASWRHMPVFYFKDAEDFLAHRPYDCQLVGIEITENARSLPGYIHPERACYILGPEDGNIPNEIISKCQSVVVIPTSLCLNVAVAGSIVLYDRIAKSLRNE